MTTPASLHPDLPELCALLAADGERTNARISSLARDYESSLQGMRLTATDDEHDPEGPTTAVDRSRTSALLESARQHLVDIRDAEERIASGSYGRCESCGEPIPRARLLARPTARTCVACADGAGPRGRRLR